jgi:tetratricopeptide (TPR) repeat protein
MHDRPITRASLSSREIPETIWNSAVRVIKKIAKNLEQLSEARATELDTAISNIKKVANLYHRLTETANEQATYQVLADVCEFDLASIIFDLATKNILTGKIKDSIFYFTCANVFYNDAIFACEKLKLEDRILELHLSRLRTYKFLFQLDIEKSQIYLNEMKTCLETYKLRDQINKDIQKAAASYLKANEHASLLKSYEDLVYKKRKTREPIDDEEETAEQPLSKRVETSQHDPVGRVALVESLLNVVAENRVKTPAVKLLQQAIADFHIAIHQWGKPEMVQEVLMLIGDIYVSSDMRLVTIMNGAKAREIARKSYDLSAALGNQISRQKLRDLNRLSICRPNRLSLFIDYLHDTDMVNNINKENLRVAINMHGAANYLKEFLVNHIDEITQTFPQKLLAEILSCFAYAFGRRLADNSTPLALIFIKCAASLKHAGAINWLDRQVSQQLLTLTVRR